MSSVRLENITWAIDDGFQPEDCGLSDTYEIENTDDLCKKLELSSMDEYEEVYGGDYDPILDYVSDQTGYLIENCHVVFEKELSEIEREV